MFWEVRRLLNFIDSKGESVMNLLKSVNFRMLEIAVQYIVVVMLTVKFPIKAI